jgi:hypothetical protein
LLPNRDLHCELGMCRCFVWVWVDGLRSNWIGACIIRVMDACIHMSVVDNTKVMLC